MTFVIPGSWMFAKIFLKLLVSVCVRIYTLFMKRKEKTSLIRPFEWNVEDLEELNDGVWFYFVGQLIYICECFEFF